MKIVQSFMLLTLFSGCASFFQQASIPLTEDHVKSYLKAYPQLLKLGPQFAPANGQVPANLQGQKGYEQLEKIVREAGFKNYQEFVKVTMKIGTAMSIVESEAGTQDLEKEVNKIGGKADELEENFKEFLANPNIPEETKAELRKNLSKGRKDIEDSVPAFKEMYEKKKEKNNAALDMMKKLASESEIALVKKYHKELRSAFSGGKTGQE